MPAVSAEAGGVCASRRRAAAAATALTLAPRTPGTVIRAVTASRAMMGGQGRARESEGCSLRARLTTGEAVRGCRP